MSADRTVLWWATAPDLPPDLANRVVWFGRDAVFVSPTGAHPAPRQAGWTPVPTGGDETSLHLVVDTRGTFGVDHPRVRRLYTHGRYHIVSVDPTWARGIDSPHYAVRPLRVPSTVFRVIEKPATVTRATSIANLVRLVSRTNLQDTIEALVAFRTRESTTPQYCKAVEWAAARFTRMGYRNCEVQAIDVNGRPSANLIVRIDGSGHTPRASVLVTAHLDSIGRRSGSPAPGADDNASGVAGVIEIARCLAGRTPACDLVLILFGGEEQGLLGSLAYVKSTVMPSQIVGVVNMDMIGTHTCTKGPTIMIQGPEVSRFMIDGVTEAAHAYTSLDVQIVTDPTAQDISDNTTFDNQSVPALLLIEGNGSRNQQKHTSFDTTKHIDSRLVRDIVRANLAFIAGICRFDLPDHSGSLTPRSSGGLVVKKRSGTTRPSSKSTPATRAGGPLVNEHDEPIVVDNFPLRLDFGSSSSHPTTPGMGKSWERDFSDDFHMLVGIFEDENGGRERHKVLRGLKGASAITFDLVRESKPSETEKLTFTLTGASGARKLVMTPLNNEFVKDGGHAGRLKPSALADLRLTHVTVGSRVIPLKGAAFRKKVTVVIVGVPE